MEKARNTERPREAKTPFAKPASEYRQTIAALEERLHLQELISDIAAILINLPAGEVDRQITGGLQRIVEFLGVDRCGFGEFSEDLKELRVTHSYAVPGIETNPGVILTDTLPWYAGRLRDGAIVAFERPSDLPEEAAGTRAFCQKTGIKSHLSIPVAIGGFPICALGFATFRIHRSWPEAFIEQFKRVAEIFAQAIYRKRAEEKLQKSYQEIRQLKDRLQGETDYLRIEIRKNFRHGEIIGESAAMQAVIRQIEQVAPTNSSVLISGETGVGKEVVARAIHSLSPRQHRLMVTVNCASLPSALVESELFGREKGAYTGALTRQPGRFELADDSSIFLDEVAELSPELQAKLLRVLQEGEFERLGSPKTLKVDVRVIAATNRDLGKAVREGKFREDLYYRLNVFPIEVPPLRERPEDIPELVSAFIDEFGKKMGKEIPALPKPTLEELRSYHWPGNIRELRNVIEHALIINNGEPLQVILPKAIHGVDSHILTLEEAERRHISEVLEKTHGRIKGAHGAAALLGLKPSTLYSRMEKLGIPHWRDKERK